MARKRLTEVHVFRTEMVGGGTSYDVYIPKRQKAYYPIAFGTYATVCVRDGVEYFHVDDFLRTPAIDDIPGPSSERSDAFQHLRKAAQRLEIRIAKRVYPELANRSKLPFLWAEWTLPSDRRDLFVDLRRRTA